MLRLRLVAALAGALLAGLSVATVAGARGEGDFVPKSRSYAFGAGTFGPACWETVHGPFCSPFNYSVRLLALRRGARRAWGEFQRRNDSTGSEYSGRVTCTVIDGNLASIGGILTSVPASSGVAVGDPFLVYVEDNGPLGAATPDRISLLVLLPEGDPDWALMPPDFPRVCPPADSLYGYVPLTAGDITVVGR